MVPIKPKKTKKLWDNDALAFAYEEAAQMLDMAEFSGDDDIGTQRAAYLEAARRIRKMAKKLGE